MTRFHGIVLILSAAAMLAVACADDGTAGTEAGSSCSRGTLIAQCPPGSDPRLDATAVSACEAAGELNRVEREGAVTGSCEGSGECVVLCRFAVPCDCGVESVMDDGIVCTDCTAQAACGHGECEGGEDPESCPIDCAGALTAGAERRNGDDREICENNGMWSLAACPDNQVCAPAEDDPNVTEYVRDVV